MKEKRSSFSGNIGFVLAAAGSAVGLGNLWRFPYLAAQYGGGIFILVYVILALTFGFALISSEIAIGRKTKKSASLAFGELHPKFGFLGKLETLVPMLILPYYSVIGGWVIKYMVTFLQGDDTAAASDGFFGEFVGGVSQPLTFFLIFFLITAVCILFGVEKGIEKASKVMMPVLLILTIGICIYVCTLDGIGAGIRFYLVPDFSKFSIKTVCAAMGQMFYSLSIAMGILITYGSYCKDDTNLTKSVNQIEIFDTMIAILAGLIIIPVVYLFNGEEGTKSSGVGLMFTTLPKIFNQMKGGRIIGSLFFVLVLFAALTSSISLMEAVISSFMDRFKIGRKKATFICIIICGLLGVPSALGFGVWSNVTLIGMDFLSFFDYITNSVIMPINAFIMCILIGWILEPSVVLKELTKNGEKPSRHDLYRVMVKYVAPVLLLVILVVYTLAQFGVISL